VIIKFPAGMLGVDTASVVGVRGSVGVGDDASFLLHPAIKRQTADKVNVVFFIRNRYLLVVNKNTNHQLRRPLLSMVFASGAKLIVVLLMEVQKPVDLVYILVKAAFP
jgi:hypothetical protein